MSYKDGTPVTKIFAELIINDIVFKNSMGTYKPSRFGNGWFDHFRSSYDCKIEDCYINVDGMWITRDKTSTDGRGNNINYHRFFWRIEPNYCCAGKPFYSAEKQAELFNKSETKKFIITSGRHSICLEWFKFLPPTETCWGLTQGPVYITVYKGSERIWTGTKSVRDKGWKKEFTEYIMEQFKWDPTQKDD